jgi:hypothetical protein
MKPINIPYVILLGIILIMGYFMIFNADVDSVDSFDEKPLREEIRIQDSIAKYWHKEASLQLDQANALEHTNDSLKNLKPLIKHHYEKKYTFNANATVHQLDSIIRSNW